MRHSPLPYVLWVLLPVAAASMGGKTLASREVESAAVSSTNRIGTLSVQVLSEEMGRQATRLIGEAPILTDPPSGSPLILAAQAGDTVAALGWSSETLTLSVALAVGSGDSAAVRATTAPFPTRTPEVITTRTGFGVALYLRGARAVSSPGDFGPEALQAGDPIQTTRPAGSILFPLAPSEASISPAQLLVGPLPSETPGASSWLTGVGIVVALGLGVLASATPNRNQPPSPRPTLRLLALMGLPLLLLWVSLSLDADRVASARGEALREDMVRVLSLLKDGEVAVSPEDLRRATGFHLLRGQEGKMVESTLAPGPLVERLLELPLPPPTFPSLGTLPGEEGEDIVYANLRDGPDRVLSLVAATEGERERNLKLLLAGLGGLASFLSLGFPLRWRRALD